MSFLPLEDFQVEFRKSNSAWDIASLEMDVYVKPVPMYFNPNAPIYSVPSSNIHIEYHPQGVIGYDVATNGNLTIKEGDSMSELQTALVEAAKTAATVAFAREATRFSHALTHSAFWEEIGPTNNVTGIEISDDYFFPRTSAGLGVAVVTVQVSNVRLDTEPGSEEIHIHMDAGHYFRGVSQPPGYSWEFPKIDDHGSTGWKVVGVFPLDWDCGQLETIIFTMRVQETDPFIDDWFHVDAFQSGPLACGAMKTRFDNGQFGLYEELPEKQLLIEDKNGGEVKGALNVRIRVYVNKQ